MKRLLYIGILLALLTLTGCYTLSIHPLYTEETAVFEPRLLGTWGDLNEAWTFKRGEDENSYRLVVSKDISMDELETVEGYDHRIIVDENPQVDGVFEVHLIRIDTVLLIDFYPAEPEGANELYVSHVIPAHSFARIHIAGDSLYMAYFDNQWFEDGLRKGDFELKHEKVEDMKVLTANTEDIQRFISEHIDQAFEDPDVAGRIK